MKLSILIGLVAIIALIAGMVGLRRVALARGPDSPTSTSALTKESTMSPTTEQAAGPRYSRSAYDITHLTDARVEELAQKLTPEERKVILAKGTERPFCGTLLDNKKKGVYVCRLCGLPLFSSDNKFDSGTGWPSFFQPFDREHVKYEKDGSLGMARVEILCTRCDAHLGHVFDDGPEPTGLRYCVNSASLDFVEKNADGSMPWPDASKPVATQVAYFGGGCFWGVEERFQKTPGVINAVSGYMGGKLKNPTYKQVCNGDTGHAEVVKVTYDPARVEYEDLLTAFFRYHDPTQLNRQGPDVGDQYRSAIFGTPEQVAAAKAFIEDRQKNSPRFKDKKIVTQVTTLDVAGEFYVAEDYHQDYSERTGHKCYIPMYDEQ